MRMIEKDVMGKCFMGKVDENLLKICFVNFKLGLNINPLKSNLR
jgi:hypothetical protein